MAEQLGKRIITELISARHDNMPKNHTIKAAMEYAYKRIDQSTLIKRNRQNIITLKHISNNFLR